MSLPQRVIPAALAAAAAVAALLGVTYLIVACQSLPGLLGPVPGDTHPRTKLGAVFVLLAVLLALGGVVTARMRGRRK